MRKNVTVKMLSKSDKNAIFPNDIHLNSILTVNFLSQILVESVELNLTNKSIHEVVTLCLISFLLRHICTTQFVFNDLRKEF